MKKIRKIWIVVILLIAFALTSCSSAQSKRYEKEFVLTTPNDLHDVLLKRVNLSIREIGLTKEEFDAVRKYGKYGNVLRAATYDWPGKSENIEFDDSIFEVGVDNFELEAISKILDINIEIEHLPFNEAINKLESGQVDMIPGVYMTPELEEKGLFLDNGTVTDFIYAYSLNDLEIDDITDLEGLKIGVMRNFNIMNDSVEQSLRDAGVNYILYDHQISEDIALEALESGELDVVFQTFSQKFIYNQCYSSNITQIFSENATNIMFTKKNEDLILIMSAIQKLYDYNDYMKTLKQDYMDMYAAMVVSTGSVFTYAEKVFIYQLGENPINVLALKDAQPYIFYDNLRGSWAGMSYQVWDAVARVAGINYNLVASEDDAITVFDKIKNGEKPEGISVFIPMYISQEKEGYLIFSTPVIVDKFVVVGLHETENLFEIYDLANKKVGIVDGFDSTKALKNYLPNENYISGYTSNDELIADLLAKNIEYIVLSESEYNEYFYTDHFYDIAIKYEISDAQSAIAFYDNTNGRALQSIYNKVVPFIKSSQIIEEFTTIDTDINQVMKSRSRDLILMFIFMFIVIIAFLAYFLRRLMKANKKVREIAFVNSITGLQNRTAFYNENTLATGSLIYVDIDNFKRFNDVYGHDIGDMYAYEIAQRILAIANENEMLAYTMDIDSFLLLDDGTSNEDKLVSISARILYEVTKTVRIYDIDHKATASIGIAVKKDEKGMEELFKKVDTALFLAKERGKNRYVIASEEEFVAHRRKQFLNEQLTKETIQREISPYYQPKIDIRDGRIIGLEALARWDSKDEGMIYPKEILPVLSENGMLPILDISILTKACRDYVDWLDKKIIDRNFVISCNMSFMTIENFDIVAAISQIHENLGMPYMSLEIEIREEDFIERLSAINDKLVELAKLGVNIAIDNFKAEHNIMSQISKLPINVIKVDKSIMQDGITKKTRELFELISTLSTRLNFGLIIEGVETAEQIQLLKEIPIYRVQGYYYGDGMDNESIERDLRVKYIYR